jgi:membrane-bound lytic murein transglycosylase D
LIKKIFLLLFCWIGIFSFVKGNTLKDTISIGNVRIAIHSSAKAIFEKEFKMLGANKRYSTALLDKMRLYFPVIEPILKEGNIPDEFKYLCVQESALNANAISTSAAVGYWQFKLETAKDVGLQVDRHIDERRHIIEATKGAVQYFTRNNTVLNNWMSTLLSYRLGLGSIKKLNYAADWAGKTDIQVDSSTDWYVIRFLAYKEFWAEKMANEPVLSPDNRLLTYEAKGGKNLFDISDELKISYDDIKKYNSWILHDYLPEEKSYTIYHPSNLKMFMSSIENPEFIASIDSNQLYQPSPKQQEKKKYKDILSEEVETRTHTVASGETMSSIASKYNMKLPELLRLNDMNMQSMLMLGQKIKVTRKVPMLEIIAQKLDQKSQNEPEKKETKPSNEIKRVKEETRKVETKEEKTSFYIAPAESREIVFKDENAPAVVEKALVKTAESTKEIERISKKPIAEPVKADDVEVVSAGSNEILTKTHTVQAGETLFRIAKTYGLLVEDIVKWNNLGKNMTVKMGQKIKISPN